MKLTRERKIYVGVLGVGLAVLGADRVMGPPSSASASSGVVVGEETAAVPVSSGVQASSVTLVALADRLEAIRADHAQRADDAAHVGSTDAFRIAPTWRAAISPQTAASEGDADAPGAVAMATSVPLPKVTVVVQDQAGGMAVLDGEVLRVGQVSRSGITLVGVERRAVRVLIDGLERTIELADFAGSAASMSSRPTR